MIGLVIKTNISGSQEWKLIIDRVELSNGPTEKFTRYMLVNRLGSVSMVTPEQVVKIWDGVEQDEIIKELRKFGIQCINQQ